MNLGDTFLMGNPGGRTKHLWIVISDPKKHHGNFVIVNLTSDPVRGEKACAVKKGEHPWLTTSDSYVVFGDAFEVTAEKSKLITNGIGGCIIAQPPMKREVIARIVEAAKCSKAFAMKLLKYLD